MTEVLSLREVSKRFGGIVAASDASFDVEEGEILGIIGPNGAGKTTIFNVITGGYPPDGGSLSFRGVALNGKRPDEIVRMGIARTFQNIRLFSNLTCLANVMTPLLQRKHYGVWPSLLRTRAVRKCERESEQEALSLLEAVGLSPFSHQKASSLPYGLQRKLEIARALATKPTLLLLDEPAAGMNPEEARALSGLIREIHGKFSLTVMLIEHHMDVVMRLCSRILVMNFGAVIAQGRPEEVRRDERVLSAYLGRRA